MEKNTRLTRQEAQEDMRDMMLSKDRALHLRKYNHILIITAYLNLSKLYRTLKEEVSSLMEENDIDLEKAISRVLNKHTSDFDELLEIEDISDDEESDDKESDEDDNKMKMIIVKSLVMKMNQMTDHM